jgi:lysozyme
MVNGVGVVQFPGAMDDKKIAEAIQTHKELKVTPSLPYESSAAIIPPELQRIENAVGVQYKLGKPVEGSDSIASVGEHEPHVIEINDKTRWNQGPRQTKGHEIVHIWKNNLPAKMQAAIPPDDPDPKKRYDISDADTLRAMGNTLVTIPQEKAATIIQTWIADPSQRKRLQPWMDDLTTIPLSVMQPTSPSDKGINTNIRPPIPPIEAYLTPAQMKERAIRARMNLGKTQVTDAGINLIKKSESFRPNVYKDSAGNPTIGYGHRIEPGEFFPNGVTHDEALAMLHKDLHTAESAVKRYVKVPLTKGQYDALVSFTFNLGVGNLANSTLLKQLNSGDYDSAGKQLLLWNHSKGKVIKALTDRRKAELALWNGSTAIPNPQDVKRKGEELQAKLRMPGGMK